MVRTAEHNHKACLQALQESVVLSQLRLAPGRKGLRKALGDVPSWVAFQDREKVEVCSHPLCLHCPFQTLHTYL